MEQRDKDILAEAVKLIKQGQNETAVKILTELLGRLPQLDNGWFLLGLALETPEKKRFAFERALKINPANDRAKMQLLRLEDDQLPKVPKPIVIEPPPPPPPPQFEAPVISTPWNDFETADGEELELPSWAKNLTPSSQKSSSDATIKSSSSSWEWEDEFPDKEDTPKAVAKDQTAAASAEESTDEEAKQDKKGKRKRSKRKEKPVKEEKSQRKRRSSKDKKEPKVEEPQEESPPAKQESLQQQLLGDARPPRRRIRWRPSRGFIFFVFLIFLCGGLGGTAYYYQDTLIPLYTQYAPTFIGMLTEQPTPTSAFTRTPTSTPASQPTLPPTWTPIFADSGERIIPTLPTYEVPPTITPTPIPLEVSVIEQMGNIQGQLQAIRGIDTPLAVDRELMAAVKFMEFMHALEISRFDPEETARQDIVMRAFGFVSSDYYAIQAMMNDSAGFYSGYYYPEQQKLYLPGSTFSDMEQFIYSFEYGRAMLENNFNFDSQFCKTGVDACLAQTALVVGDAALTTEIWLETYPTDFDPTDFFDLEDPAPVFQDNWTPPYFDAYRKFPIRYGEAFVKHLYQDNGWQTVNYTYRFPPETSEQIIHLDKYDDRERPVLLYDPDLIPLLGADWELVEQDILGEWRSFLLLSVPDYPQAALPENEALIAAAGWGGDTYRVYHNPETGGVVLSAHWNWDTSADQGEFFDALETSLSGRFDNSTYPGPEGSVCWTLNGEYSCLFQNTRDVLWLYATDPTILETIKSAFGQFP